MSSITLLLLEEITLYVLPTLQLDNVLPAITLIMIVSLTSVVSKLFHSQPLSIDMQLSFFAFDIPCRHLASTGLPWGSNHWIYLVHLLGCSRSSYLGRAMQVKLISAPTINVRFGRLEKVFISCVTRRKIKKKIKCVVLEVT